ncbi:MAG: threo-3-hydroxy-L-aspartate ammonia-lyase [Bacteroidetes bacterium]|nr:threo-3-hydroxy-L-aspartate ammonia-lyase [Bacteroidota bacterium]
MEDADSEGTAEQGILAVSYEDICEASEVIADVVRRTPVATSRTLDSMTGCSVHLKCENLQRTGTFKIRGAYNALSRFSGSERKKGVLTFSSGNHAQAVALSGSLLGIPVTVIMPGDAPAIKRAATERYGATIISYDKLDTTREDLALRISEELNLPILPPYDHPHIVAGQGTVGRELLIENPDLDVLLVCCGGGGLLSGCSISVKSLNPDCRIIGVEPDAADDATRSFHSGRLHSVHNPDTVADGARTPYLGKITFPLIRHYVDDMVTVSEESILRSMLFLWEHMKLVVEPTGALALAALLDGTVRAEDKKVGVVISGGNVDMSRAFELFSRIKN